jgi:ribosomal protein S18 acetylase RimI-like enzyme
MQYTYRELYPDQNFAHLAQTVEQYFSVDTPLWWVETQPQTQLDKIQPDISGASAPPTSPIPSAAPIFSPQAALPAAPVACLWLGTAIDQVKGWRYPHIFLLYVRPAHRRQGIGSALIDYAESWARARGNRQIGLQVFQHNEPALQLYTKLGYQPQALSMVKPIEQE